MARLNQHTIFNQTTCNWRTEGGRCENKIEKTFEDSKLGYCLEHYEKVYYLRNWIYLWTMEGTWRKNLTK